MGPRLVLVVAVGAIALAALPATTSDARSRRHHVPTHHNGQDIPPDQCPAAGTAGSAAGRAANVLKNRDSAPSDSEINANVTTQAMLADGDDNGRFSESQAAEITGVVIKVEQGGHPETANCGNLSTLYTDTHITVALDPQAPLTQTLVVEVTPKWRAIMAKQGIDWRTETLRATLDGHRVNSGVGCCLIEAISWRR